MELQQRPCISFAATRLTSLFRSLDFALIQDFASHYKLSSEPDLGADIHYQSMANDELSANEKSNQKILNVKLGENNASSFVINRNDHTFYAIEKPHLERKSNGFRISTIRNSDKISIRSSDKVVNNDVVIPALTSYGFASTATNDAGCSAWPTCSVSKMSARLPDNSENLANGRSDKLLNGISRISNNGMDKNENFRKPIKEKVSFEQCLSSADAFYVTHLKNGKRRISMDDQNDFAVTTVNLDLPENLASPVKMKNEEKSTVKKSSQKRTSKKLEKASPPNESQSMPILLKSDSAEFSPPNFASPSLQDEGNASAPVIDVPFLDVDVLYDFNLGFDETVYYEKLINNLTTPFRIFLEKSEPLPVAVYNEQCQRGPAGYYHDHLFVDADSQCVFCCKCKQMLSLLRFITHFHGQRKVWKDAIQRDEETSIPNPQLFMFVKNASKDRFDLWRRLCDKVRHFDALPNEYLTDSVPEKLISKYAEVNRHLSASIADPIMRKDPEAKVSSTRQHESAINQYDEDGKTEASSNINSEISETRSILSDLFPNLVTSDTSLLDTGLTTVVIPDPLEIDDVAQDTAEILLSLSRIGQNSI